MADGIRITHWLYCASTFATWVEVEDNCQKCSHVQVCKRDMYSFCENYLFGTPYAKLNNCQSCTHKYTRWDQRQPIPCFKCKFYDPEVK